jgi:FHS family glucose/mannose:H+ symporter-like MFS transporter
MHDLSLIQWVTIATSFVFGMELALLGSIKLPLAKRLQIDETRVGGMLSALNFALIPMMLLSGLELDFWSIQWVIVTGSVVTALGILLLGWASNYRACLGAMLLAGFAGASLSVAGTKLMPQVFFPGNPAAAINLGNVFFGLGALLTPVAATVLMRGLGYRGTITLVALIFLAPAVLAFMTPATEWDKLTVRPDDLESLLPIVQNPVFWLISLALFFYVPTEFALGTWATTYLTNRGFGERAAALLLSGFWLALMLSRLGASFLLKLEQMRGWEAWLVVGLAMLTALSLSILVAASRKLRAANSLLLAGVCMGPIFPTLVGLLLGQMDPRLHGTAYGASFSLGLVGGILFPPLVGYLARRWWLQRALVVTVLWAIAVTALATMLALSI